MKATHVIMAIVSTFVLATTVSNAGEGDFYFSPEVFVDQCGCPEQAFAKCDLFKGAIELEASSFTDAKIEFQNLCEEQVFIDRAKGGCECWQARAGADFYDKWAVPREKCEVGQAMLGKMLIEPLAGACFQVAFGNENVLCE